MAVYITVTVGLGPGPRLGFKPNMEVPNNVSMWCCGMTFA